MYGYQVHMYMYMYMYMCCLHDRAKVVFRSNIIVSNRVVILTPFLRLGLGAASIGVVT